MLYFLLDLKEMKQPLLPERDLLVLLAILRLREAAYGVSIAREIESTTHRSVAIAFIYLTLDRLSSQGLVRSWMGDPSPARGGRAKRCFEVTGKGIRRVRETQVALMALWRGLPELEGEQV